MKTIVFAATNAAPRTLTRPQEINVSTDTNTNGHADPTYQVVLHNDDHNEAGYVMRCLMKVFSHGRELAVKIMMEAHTKGRSIAEVEAETPAIKHRDQLRSLGLSATVEKVD